LNTTVDEALGFTFCQTFVDGQADIGEIGVSGQNTIERIDRATESGPFRGLVGRAGRGWDRSSSGIRSRRRRGRRGDWNSGVGRWITGVGVGCFGAFVQGDAPGLSTFLRTVSCAWSGALRVGNGLSTNTMEFVAAITLTSGKITQY
jgi:hypothetical protein